MRNRLLFLLFFACLGLPMLGAAAVAIAASFAWQQLPSLEAIADYKPRIPLRIYTADGALIGEFGEERRTFAAIQDVPSDLQFAIISAEDDRFFEHSGVDIAGLIRASLLNLSGASKQGGSTITMQVARNFYLSREKTVSRKFYEILLSLKIEHYLSKEQILEVYINQIYLGQRAYGFAAASQAYYGKPLKKLSLAEFAMLAGLPKAPSKYNPVVNPKRATERQHYVLRRMHELGHITDQALEIALKDPLRLVQGKSAVEPTSPLVHAEYVAEMARQLAYEQFKDAAYTSGIKVITTIKEADQKAAYASLRKGLLDYERRHAYRGAEAQVDPSKLLPENSEVFTDLIEPYPDLDEMRAAIVSAVTPTKIEAYLRNGQKISIVGNSVKYVASMMGKSAPIQKRIAAGAIIRVIQTASAWLIVQAPEVEGAFVSIDPHDGAIRSLVGGFDFNRNKFNHVTQAWRQPGSSFKPFIFSAAVDKGLSPGSVFDDEPLSFSAEETGSKEWNPGNYDGKYSGPMSLRTALAKSKNVVAIRVLQAINPAYAQDYVTSRFGFDPAKNPPYLTLALGSGAVTPWQMAGGYAVFANGGYRVRPYIVKEILDANDTVLAKVDPPLSGSGESERVLDPRNVFLVDLMMKDVVRRGTAAKAMSLGRGDLAGKTGTTNEYVDAWFCGYQPSLVGIAWVGFDQPKKLGSNETGGALALPIWIDYMRQGLKQVPEQYMEQPPGLIEVTPKFSEEGPDYVYAEYLPHESQEIQQSSPNALN